MATRLSMKWWFYEEAGTLQDHSRRFPANVKLSANKGATTSYKQIVLGEANVQLTFHEKDLSPAGTNWVLVEPDIDYFKDTAAHIMLEVVPAMLKEKIYGTDSAKSLTDPRVVYGLRWIAGRRIGRDFEPPYTIN